MTYAATITTLIDKVDVLEEVADRIAEILKVESVSQMALATAALEDPTLWDLRVFRDRLHPWESWHDAASTDQRPIINVWVESTAIERGSSDVSRRQRYRARVAIDVYGRGLARDDGATGQVPGDLDAARVRDRGARLVRNILAASTTVYLGLRGKVHGGPLISGYEFFAPDREDRNTPIVRAVRLACEVEYNEESPQYEPETLEYVGITVTRAEDGELLAQWDIDYTP